MDEKKPEQTDPPKTHSAAEDQATGGTTEAGGRIKESIGALTGDERLKAEGEKDQVKGEVRRKKGSLKQRIKAWVDKW